MRIRSCLVIGLGLLPVLWSDVGANPLAGGTQEPQPPRSSAAESSLTDLVQRFLSADPDSLPELKKRIVAHPHATIEAVSRILREGRRYETRPTGKFPHQSIEVRGEPHHFGLYVPASYDPAKGSALVICLHGAGFTGDSYLDRWIPRLNEQYVLACPTLSMGAWWIRQGEELVLATIRAVRSNYHIDPDRIFLTGMSNGGIGAWIIGMHQADRFAGIAPMAGGIDEVLYPFLENLKHTPVYVIHGLHDRVMPVSLSRMLVNEMLKRGVPHVYREHNYRHPHAGGHFFPREELPALIQWFDRQRRQALPRAFSVVQDATHLRRRYWVRLETTDRIAAFSEQLIDRRDEFITGRVYASLNVRIDGQNRIVVEAVHVRRYSVFLNDELVDLSKPILVETNGRESYHAEVAPNLEVLLREARIRRDPGMLFPVQVTVEVQ